MGEDQGQDETEDRARAGTQHREAAAASHPGQRAGSGLGGAGHAHCCRGAGRNAEPPEATGPADWPVADWAVADWAATGWAVADSAAGSASRSPRYALVSERTENSTVHSA